jgi:hypothetical protein
MKGWNWPKIILNVFIIIASIVGGSSSGESGIGAGIAVAGMVIALAIYNK